MSTRTTLIRTGLFLVAASLAGVGALGVRAATLTSRQLDVAPRPIEVDAQAAAARLAEALAIPTLSRQDGSVDEAAFEDLHQLLMDRFPAVHDALERERVDGYSLLYTWRGTDPSLPPVILLGHLDVVPVAPGTEAEWVHDPFSGTLEDGWIWGRGALDDKHNVLGQLEAVERLLHQGYQPQRTVYLAYGHDEERGGAGAQAIVATLQRRGVRARMVLDEGGAIVTDGLPGLAGPAALIGIAEKGYATVTLEAASEGGHASMPPPSTASGRIGAAVAALEARPMPASVSGPAAQMFDWLAPEMGGPMRLVFANRWLLEPVIRSQMVGKNSTNALIRTTHAVTMLEGAPQENVLPARARARVNYRILPGDTPEAVLAHVRSVVEPFGVTASLDPRFLSPPSPVSPVDGPFLDLQAAIHEVFPEAVVAPYLVLGATDARHYAPLSDHVYRFSPMMLSQADLARIHGTNERLSVEGYGRLVAFYVRLVERAGSE